MFGPIFYEVSQEFYIRLIILGNKVCVHVGSLVFVTLVSFVADSFRLVPVYDELRREK